MGDVGVFAYYAQQNPDKDFNMTRDTSFEDQYFGIAVRKGNTELLDKVNGALKELKDDGTLQSIVDKYITAE